MRIKNIRRISALLLALVLACCPVVTQAASIEETAVMHAAKFNAAAAKKNISITYKKVENGVLAICKNKNSYSVKLSATVKFLDMAKTVLTTETDKVECLGARKTCVLFFRAPLTDTGDYKVYHSLKKNVKVSKTTAKDYSGKMITTTNLQPTMFNLSVLNNSGKALDVIRVSCVLYDGAGSVKGYVQKYVTCYAKGASVLETIPYPSVCPSPSKVKVYIDAAYKL